jgi:hypothetical protein
MSTVSMKEEDAPMGNPADIVTVSDKNMLSRFLFPNPVVCHFPFGSDTSASQADDHSHSLLSHPRSDCTSRRTMSSGHCTISNLLLQSLLTTYVPENGERNVMTLTWLTPINNQVLERILHEPTYRCSGKCLRAFCCLQQFVS